MRTTIRMKINFHLEMGIHARRLNSPSRFRLEPGQWRCADANFHLLGDAKLDGFVFEPNTVP